MSIQEIDRKVQELRELQALVEEATTQMEAIKDAIKLKMVDEGTEVLQGNGWKATWHTVTSSRLDSKALKAAYPDLVAQYSKPSATTRIRKAPCITADQSRCKEPHAPPHEHIKRGDRLIIACPPPEIKEEPLL